MEYETVIQSTLDNIDKRIHEKIRATELAQAVNYSVYHFCRVFLAITGTSVMNYVIGRKLEYSLYELSQGRKVIDVAAEYGFETHTGFAKAFKKHFGFPPSLCHLRINAGLPERATIAGVKIKHGGFTMNPHISVVTPFTVAGRTTKKTMPAVKAHYSTPAFAFIDEHEDETDNLLRDTQELFAKSDNIKHCEISMVYDVDPNSGEFTYLLGRGIFHPEDLAKIPPDMVSIEISGLYAIFPTPPVNFDHELVAKAIEDTWNDIFTKWLPNSEFEYDEERKDFEFYDERDHGHYFGNKRQMDIYIPIRMKEEAQRISKEKEQSYGKKKCNAVLSKKIEIQ